MNLPNNSRGLVDSDLKNSGPARHFNGALILLEITLATVIVVGLFAAVFQPFGWASLLQFVLCGLLGALLAFVDGKLDTEQSDVGDEAPVRRLPEARTATSFQARSKVNGITSPTV
jgi:hypothetical protein